jgi:FkbM family methyltransferase
MQNKPGIRDGMEPSTLHELARFLGTRFNGTKGVDRILRTLHHPDKRQNSWIKTTKRAYPKGPIFNLESRWFTEWTTLFYGTQDKHIHRWMVDNVAADWIAFDVGANFGYYTCLLAGLCRQVHAFEPVPWLADRMEGNVDLNGFRNVTINRAALSEAEGTVPLNLPDRSDANWGTSSLVHQSGRNHEQIKVPATTLDSYCRQNNLRVDFIKLDVEGAEHFVLRGGLETLRRWKPRMVIENNRESFDEIRGVLHSLNYEIRSVTGAVLSEQENATELHDIIAIAR